MVDLDQLEQAIRKVRSAERRLKFLTVDKDLGVYYWGKLELAPMAVILHTSHAKRMCIEGAKLDLDEAKARARELGVDV